MKRKPIRALLIEDNPGDARLIQEMLSEKGANWFDLKLVSRLSEGLEQLESGGVDAVLVDVVLLDLGLPDSQGIYTLLRVHEHVPSLPIVVLTGLSDEELALRAVQLGAQDYLIKGQVSSNLLAYSIYYAVERKRAEEALRRSEEKYSTLVESGSDGIIIIQDGVLTFANSKMVAITGFSLEQTLGREFIEFIAPPDRALLADRYRKRISGGAIPAKYEIEILSRDGRQLPAEINVSIIEYEGKPVDMAIIRAVSVAGEWKRGVGGKQGLEKTGRQAGLPSGRAFYQEERREFLGGCGIGRGEARGPVQLLHRELERYYRREAACREPALICQADNQVSGRGAEAYLPRPARPYPAGHVHHVR